MSKTNSTHYKLCIEAAKWLQKTEYCKYVAVELITYGDENPDVWGTTGWNTYIIEVKTSRRDFLADKNKPSRQKGKGIANFRYYLLPEGAVELSEVPKKWGVLLHDGEKITKILRHAQLFGTEVNGDISMLCSIMRREGIKKQIFNYRHKTEKK